jgi:uncharacterized membrane protein (DUF373 family)
MRLKEIFDEVKFTKVLGAFLGGFLLAGAVVYTAYAIYSFLTKITVDAVEAFKSLILDVLNVIIILELFESVKAFISGRGKSVIYIADATLAFLLREFIVALFGNQTELILPLAASAIAIGVVRFVVSRGS